MRTPQQQRAGRLIRTAISAWALCAALTPNIAAASTIAFTDGLGTSASGATWAASSFWNFSSNLNSVISLGQGRAITPGLFTIQNPPSQQGFPGKLNSVTIDDASGALREVTGGPWVRVTFPADASVPNALSSTTDVKINQVVLKPNAEATVLGTIEGLDVTGQQVSYSGILFSTQAAAIARSTSEPLVAGGSTILMRLQMDTAAFDALARAFNWSDSSLTYASLGAATSNMGSLSLRLSSVPVSVPEPGSLPLMGLGLGLTAWAWRRNTRR